MYLLSFQHCFLLNDASISLQLSGYFSELLNLHFIPFIFLSEHKHPRLSFHRGSKKLKGQYFVLRLKQSAIDKGVKGYIEGKLFRIGKRVYTITYLGHNDNNVDAFMKSFRLIN